MSITASGTLSAAGAGFAVLVSGRASVYVSGNCVWHLERSYDASNWETLTLEPDEGTPARFSGARSLDIDEGIDDVYYRVVVETITSGDVEYRITAAANDTISPVSTGSGVELITNGGEVGDTMTIDVGDWDGVTPIDYSYQWYDNAVAISGADDVSLVVTTAMDAHTITGEVVATNIGGALTASDTVVIS